MRQGYLILNRTYGAEHIEKMMCRVVDDKFQPMHKFAPRELRGSNAEASHNTNDIIKDILPEPRLLKRRDFLHTVEAQGFHSALAKIFNLELDRNREEKLTLESDLVKQYELANPGDFFEPLMKNELYARDVRELLKGTSLGNGYLVTGFMTITNSRWIHHDSKGHSAELKAILPLSEIAGVPAGLDTTINPSANKSVILETQMHIEEEVIFAVSYTDVKIPMFKRSKVMLGRPTRTNDKHLGLGNDDDKEDDGVHEDVILVPADDDDDDDDDDEYSECFYLDE